MFLQSYCGNWIHSAVSKTTRDTLTLVSFPFSILTTFECPMPSMKRERWVHLCSHGALQQARWQTIQYSDHRGLYRMLWEHRRAGCDVNWLREMISEQAYRSWPGEKKGRGPQLNTPSRENSKYMQRHRGKRKQDMFQERQVVQYIWG